MTEKEAPGVSTDRLALAHEAKRRVDEYVDAWIAKNTGPAWAERIGTTKSAVVAAIDRLAAALPQPQKPVAYQVAGMFFKATAPVPKELEHLKIPLYAAPPQPVPAEPPPGWKLVPLEPTDEMRAAYYGPKLAGPHYTELCAGIYRAMLAATPLVQPAPPTSRRLDLAALTEALKDLPTETSGDLAGAQGDVPGAPAS
jgi:hypothetical protein